MTTDWNIKTVNLLDQRPFHWAWSLIQKSMKDDNERWKKRRIFNLDPASE
jgi:hypothetical protein